MRWTRGPGEPAEFGDELAHRAALAEIAVSGHMRGEITLQPLLVIPVGAGRVARPPFFPVGIGRRHVDELVTEPDPAHRQVRIEPDIRPDELAMNRSAFQEVRRGPMDREPGAGADRRRRRRMDDLRLVVDVIGTELDAVRDAAASR